MRLEMHQSEREAELALCFKHQSASRIHREDQWNKLKGPIEKDMSRKIIGGMGYSDPPNGISLVVLSKSQNLTARNTDLYQIMTAFLLESEGRKKKGAHFPPEKLKQYSYDRGDVPISGGHCRRSPSVLCGPPSETVRNASSCSFRPIESTNGNILLTISLIISCLTMLASSR